MTAGMKAIMVARQVVGCSGAVFGFMGLYVADMALNFKSLSFPWLRLIWIGATLAYFLVASITQASLLTMFIVLYRGSVISVTDSVTKQ